MVCLVSGRFPGRTFPIWQSDWLAKRNHVLGEVQSPKGKSNFWELSGPLKTIVSYYCRVYINKINKGIDPTGKTAAADCTAPDAEYVVLPSQSLGLLLKSEI